MSSRNDGSGKAVKPSRCAIRHSQCSVQFPQRNFPASGRTGKQAWCRKVGEGEGTEERERVIGKAAEDECVFIPSEGPGWQMRSRSDAIPDVAGDESGHGPLPRMA